MVVYTDGGCRGNPGPGGWGYLVLNPEGTALAVRGGESQTTNNRMEMSAAILALESLPPGEVEVRTDSRYLVDMATKWMAGWKRRGWRKPDGEIKNLDLVQRLDGLLCARKITWTWIRGHSGEPGNEFVDRLTNLAMDAVQRGTKPEATQLFSSHPVKV